ncbi:hypothetical protein CR513_19819, partial [Mucuna pruriens]
VHLRCAFHDPSECHASNVVIEIVQERHPIAYFSEELKGAYFNYSTYDQEFYALVKQGTQAPNLRLNSVQKREDDAYMEGHDQELKETLMKRKPLHLKDQ